MKLAKVLTIAGSDSGGGAGIQADLKTYTVFGVFGMSAITSVTAQNTRGVYGIHDLPPDFVELQIRTVLQDIGADVIKTGMLSSKEIIQRVVKVLREYKELPVVVDPVMRAKGGDPLLRPDAQDALINEMLPLAYVVTPNIPEAEALTGMRIKTLADMKNAAKKIKQMGPDNVIVKGGHLGNGEAVDILYDGNQFYEFSSERIDTKNTHGTGCTFASAIAANLALGYNLIDAVQRAKDFLTGAIKNSLNIGHGHGPLNHMFQVKPGNVEFDEFTSLDIRIGKVLSAEYLKGAKIPSIAMKIDFGSLGIKQSSARITKRYRPEDLIGRSVVAVTNFPPKRIAGFRSDVLVLGAIPSEGDVILLKPDEETDPGTPVG